MTVHFLMPTTAFLVTIFVGAFLLFQVQPIIAKVILPWFGGAPSVWTTCLLFFQSLLFIGYAASHLLVTRAPLRRQVVIYVGLLALSAVLLGIVPTEDWKPVDPSSPLLQVLTLLAAHVGLPYTLLSMTSPLVQAWFAQAFPERNPYPLYSLSNAGSLLALVSFPIVFEPWIGLNWQVRVWSIGYFIFVGAFALSGLMATRRATNATISRAAVETAPPPSRLDQFLWFMLPACSSILLLAITNVLCQDVAPMPFLFVFPLGLYLLSFIVVFADRRWYSRLDVQLVIVMAVLMVLLMTRIGSTRLVTVVGTYLILLFACCLALHGQLAKLRPGKEHLTRFYLMLSGGSAIGAVFVAVVAPYIFDSFYELPIGLGMFGVLVCTYNMWSRKWRMNSIAANVFFVVTSLIIGVLPAVAAMKVTKLFPFTEHQSRNFYGITRILRADADKPERHRLLQHSGKVVHGIQFVDPEKRNVPTSYYGAQSGLGIAMTALHERGSLRIGVIGLGTGSMATYGRAGDYIRFYEINKDIIDLTPLWFSFLRDSPADIEIVLGDARLSLEREANQNFDVLVLDAFSGDSIPIHLLTHEAFTTYLRHLEANGVIAIHISNQYLGLEPVVNGLAKAFGFFAVRVYSAGNESRGWYPADWMILSRDQEFFSAPEFTAAAVPAEQREQHAILWTDNFSNLFQILRFERD